MRFSTCLAGFAAVTSVSAARFSMKPVHWLNNTADDDLEPSHSSQLAKRATFGSSTNPWTNKKLFANPEYAAKLEDVYEEFKALNDTADAAKVRTIQDVGTFVWISQRSSLGDIDDAIESARKVQKTTGEDQMVGLVLYDLPGRDCSAGESAGELDPTDAGLETYKTEFIQPYAQKLAAAKDLSFAVILEPDSLGNLVTNQKVPLCKKAAPYYEKGLAYAIGNLQFEHVHLYIDAAHGGWLGWPDNLEPAAKEFSKVVKMAQNHCSSNSTAKIRGFSTNVSNYNPFRAPGDKAPAYAQGSPSFDESHYTMSLAPYLKAQGLPTRFIVDQGRVAPSRESWSEWCNVVPSGYGMPPGSSTGNNTLIDSIVWVKPGGESDGECGLKGAPKAGAWFLQYVVQMVKNADPRIFA